MNTQIPSPFSPYWDPEEYGWLTDTELYRHLEVHSRRATAYFGAAEKWKERKETVKQDLYLRYAATEQERMGAITAELERRGA